MSYPCAYGLHLTHRLSCLEVTPSADPLTISFSRHQKFFIFLITKVESIGCYYNTNVTAYGCVKDGHVMCTVYCVCFGISPSIRMYSSSNAADTPCSTCNQQVSKCTSTIKIHKHILHKIETYPP